MDNWFIEWEDATGNWLDAQEVRDNKDIIAALEEGGYKLKGAWFPTSPTNALCLSYHGGWIACHQIVKGRKHAGYLYSQDKAILPKPKPLTKKQKAALDRILMDLSENNRDAND